MRRVDTWGRPPYGRGGGLWIVCLYCDLLLPAAIPDYIREHPFDLKGFTGGWRRAAQLLMETFIVVD